MFLQVITSYFIPSGHFCPIIFSCNNVLLFTFNPLLKQISVKYFILLYLIIILKRLKEISPYLL